METNFSTTTTDKQKQDKVPLRSVYFWVLSYVRPYIGLLSLLVISGLIVTSIQVSIPKGVQYFIDDIYPNHDISMFWWLIAGFTSLLLVMFGFMALQNLLQRSFQEKAARDLQFDIFKHLRTMGFAYFEQRPIGESLAFMNTEVASLQEFFKWLFLGLIRNSIVSLISVAVMLSISVQLTLIMIPCLLLYYLVGPYFEKKAALLAKQLANDRVALNQKSYESISALSELRAHNAEVWDRQRFMGILQTYMDTRVKTLWFAYWRGTIRRLSYYIGGVAIIIYGIYLVQNSLLSIGGMAAFLMYYFQVMQTITVVITIITEQKLLMGQAEKIYRFIKTEPEVKEASDPIQLQNPKGEISFHNVGFRYVAGPKVLENFNLHIESGKRIALVGTSGNGKSTILKLMVRFYDPQQGDICLDGIPLNKLSFADLRETIGYVFQETYLFGASVRDNILFGRPDASEEEVIAAAKAAYAHDFIMELDNGYDTLLGERGIKLSGGQKQRISIARLFLKNPTIVLLDEATSALDNASEKEVQAALDKLLYGRTTITVAHRLSTVQDYDEIAVISDGRIIEVGTHNELVNKRKNYYDLVAGENEKKRGAAVV
ncbi:ABC transporter ATP-binding protein [Chengkuizengella axinellae]|uniref:ABC transporter ATP-binding protein n=1 Tax=Chengkuizengella axinellae TaxID=3064388 RepID=A0ABT9IWL4_9BACL|nr:ABC transporter ATP-binding protein [Chengkuizengella sp. 2205SS18-9]MDP5273725.1 ABC transporter ATP-binding protein [Chengkuizengella sp. 2205SS18-9]